MEELNRDSTESRPLQNPVPVGTPLRERADRLRIVEEKRQFRPLLYWYLTFRCNLACEHCSVHSSPWVDNSRDLTTEECMKVIDQMADLNVAVALLTGGEVLIRPDALQIFQALVDRGIKVGLETNGIHYPPGFFQLAREFQARNMFVMTISLDGGTRETHERLRGPHSFERTVRGLRALKENGIHFDVQCVLNGSNVETIPDLYRLANELSPECETLDWAVLSPIGRGIGLVQELGLGPQDLSRIFELVAQGKPTFPGTTNVKVPPAVIPPKYLPLFTGKSKAGAVTSCQFPLLGVLPNGDVTICALSREDESLSFGSIRDEGVSLKGVWEKARMDMLRSRYVAAEDLAGICGDCIWKYTCKGACRAWAFEDGGSFDAPYPICKALDEAGAFPKLYRLSLQNAAMVAKFRQMEIGCGCSS